MSTAAAGTGSTTRAARAGAKWVAAFALVLVPAQVAAQAPKAPQGIWLDEQPLGSWNTSEAPVPMAPDVDEERGRLLERCRLTSQADTTAASAVAAAGWIPFRLFDREIVNGDVEVIGGMAGADGMCRPAPLNAFVFVGGRFAGTLSPVPMVSREDGSIGPVRLMDNQLISAEFVRYAASDPLCCPSSRVAVRFRIDRSGPHPVVTPMDVRKIR